MASHLPPPPPGLDIYESHQAKLNAINYAMWSLTILAVSGRFISRKMSGVELWWDDWLVIPSFIFVTIQAFASGEMMIKGGLGRHIWALEDPSPAGLKRFYQGLFINQVTYAPALLFAKCSILFLYWRLFKTSLRWWIFGLLFLIITWGIALTIATFLLCTPLQKFWDHPLPGKCLDQRSYVTSTAVPNFITDFIILAIPLPLVWKLQISIQRKLILTLIFIFGGFIAGISTSRLVIIRIYGNYTSPDITWNSINVHNLSIVETNCGTICCCLPTLKPVLSLLSPSFEFFKSKFDSSIQLLAASSRRQSHVPSKAETSSTLSDQRPVAPTDWVSSDKKYNVTISGPHTTDSLSPALPSTAVMPAQPDVEANTHGPKDDVEQARIVVTKTVSLTSENEKEDK